MKNNDEQNGQLLLFADDDANAAPEYTAETLPYFDNPSDDGERLMNAQHDFLLFNSEKAWRELWTLTVTVAGRIISAERQKNKFYLSADEKADKQMEAAEYLLRRYRTRCGYFIRANFISAVKQSVYHALYYRNEGEKLVDFIAIEKMENIPYNNF
ncbi:MAG: hypothetical protein ACTTKL_11580 [Treponema sp.]